MPVSRTTVINRDNQEIHFYNKDGEKKLLGTVIVDTVEEEGLRRQYFEPAADNPFKQQTNEEKAYNLGFGSGELRVIDPATSLEPLLEKGWTITDQMAHRGGTELVTVLTKPEIQWDDPIKYDQARWLATDVHGKEFVSTVRACITVTHNLHIGHCPATYMGGLFRLLCSNLAEAEILGLPSFRYFHNTWDISKAEAKLEELGYGMSNLPGLPTGPMIAPVSLLGKIRSALSLYRDELQGFKPKTDTIVPKQFSVFNPVKMPDWSLNNFIGELNELEKAYGPDDMVNAFDILNCYTNAINWHNQTVRKIDRGTWSAIRNSSDVVTAITEIANLIKFVSFFEEANQVATADVYNDLNIGGEIPKRKGYKTVIVETAKKEKPEVKKHVSITPEMTDDIPEHVLYSLIGLHKSSGGTVNMKNRKEVIERVYAINVPSAEWLEQNPKYFFAAVTKATTKFNYDIKETVEKSEEDIFAQLNENLENIE